MGIDQIRLSSELIQSLYPETLVDGPTFFLGKNLKQICFLVHCAEFDFLPEDQIVFLGKILPACKLSMDDIIVINTARLTLTFDELRNQFQPVIIILWGIRQDILGVSPDLPDFTISKMDGISVVRVPSPELMTENDLSGHNLKQQLWMCLKKLFNL
jgi:hypothetical protein